MSYEKHTWETGETITAEKLNNLEDGIEETKLENCFYRVNLNGSLAYKGASLGNQTYNDILEAYNAGQIPIIIFDGHVFRVMIADKTCKLDPANKSCFVFFSIEPFATQTNINRCYWIIVRSDNNVSIQEERLSVQYITE